MIGVMDATNIVTVANGWEGDDVMLTVPQMVCKDVEDPVALPSAYPGVREMCVEGLKREVKDTPLNPERVADKEFPEVLVPVERGKVEDGVGVLPSVDLSDNVGESAVDEGENDAE